MSNYPVLCKVAPQQILRGGRKSQDTEAAPVTLYKRRHHSGCVLVILPSRAYESEYVFTILVGMITYHDVASLMK
jgi:hypothetical protein